MYLLIAHHLHEHMLISMQGLLYLVYYTCVCASHLLINRETEFSEEEIQALGELGVVTIVTFNALERSDTGEYMCTATNSLPGEETGVLMAIPPTILLTVLGWQ